MCLITQDEDEGVFTRSLSHLTAVHSWMLVPRKLPDFQGAAAERSPGQKYLELSGSLTEGGSQNSPCGPAHFYFEIAHCGMCYAGGYSFEPSNWASQRKLAVMPSISVRAFLGPGPKEMLCGHHILLFLGKGLEAADEQPSPCLGRFLRSSLEVSKNCPCRHRKLGDCSCKP